MGLTSSKYNGRCNDAPSVFFMLPSTHPQGQEQGGEGAGLGRLGTSVPAGGFRSAWVRRQGSCGRGLSFPLCSVPGTLWLAVPLQGTLWHGTALKGRALAPKSLSAPQQAPKSLPLHTAPNISPLPCHPCHRTPATLHPPASTTPPSHSSPAPSPPCSCVCVYICKVRTQSVLICIVTIYNIAPSKTPSSAYRQAHRACFRP